MPQQRIDFRFAAAEGLERFQRRARAAHREDLALEAAPGLGQVLGAVLNDVRTEGIYRHYAYVYGYTADELVSQKEIGPGATAAAS